VPSFLPHLFTRFTQADEWLSAWTASRTAASMTMGF
jgi:hypothetical protein